VNAPSLVAVVGPTATGKSDLGLALAAELGGEVVNADAMQLYRGMDIGTAKLPVAERRGVVHHLLDTQDVTETATVAQFQAWARAVNRELRERIGRWRQRHGPGRGRGRDRRLGDPHRLLVSDSLGIRCGHGR